VGLNFDLGHFMIADISAETAARYGDRFVNAHISDHPSTHIKDQVPGRWNSVFRNPEKFEAMVGVYHEAVQLRKRGGLPISGSVSLELEGCGNHAWINQGLGTLRHLLSYSDGWRLSPARHQLQGRHSIVHAPPYPVPPKPKR
jgi:sugar phosphate isomerase/epimerase